MWDARFGQGEGGAFGELLWVVVCAVRGRPRAFCMSCIVRGGGYCVVRRFRSEMGRAFVYGAAGGGYSGLVRASGAVVVRL